MSPALYFDAQHRLGDSMRFYLYTQAGFGVFAYYKLMASEGGSSGGNQLKGWLGLRRASECCMKPLNPQETYGALCSQCLQVSKLWAPFKEDNAWDLGINSSREWLTRTLTHFYAPLDSVVYAATLQEAFGVITDVWDSSHGKTIVDRSILVKQAMPGAL